MDLSIIIPVFNSEKTLEELVTEITVTMNTINKSYEMIFVDDGSKDNSWDVLLKLQKNNPKIITIAKLMKNFGQHNALMCGFNLSSGKLVVTMDDDLQNPPSEIKKLITHIEANKLDLVYGHTEEKKHKFWRNIGTTIIRFFFKVVFKTKAKTTSFRIINRELILSILAYNLNYTYIDGLLAWNTSRIGNVTVHHNQRKYGQSGYSIGKLIALAFNLFTNFSLIPLQVVSGVGVITAICGFLASIYYIAQYFLSNISIPGYASIIIAILILGGVQLLALGIIGEYLGRLHLNMNKKPQYSVRTVISKSE